MTSNLKILSTWVLGMLSETSQLEWNKPISSTSVLLSMLDATWRKAAHAKWSNPSSTQTTLFCFHFTPGSHSHFRVAMSQLTASILKIPLVSLPWQLGHSWLRHWLAQSMRKNICMYVWCCACKRMRHCTQKVDELEFSLWRQCKRTLPTLLLTSRDVICL